MLRSAVVLTAALLVATPVSAQDRLTIGQTLRGELTTGDFRHEDGSYVDCYVLEAPAGQRLQINMTSLAFDSFLAVGEGSCGRMTSVEQDDDSGGGVNARIVRETTGRPLIIVANSVGAGATGPYSLRASPDRGSPPADAAPSAGRAPAARTDSSVTSLTVGQTFNGALSSSDRLMSDGTFFDCFSLPTRAGQALQIDMTSNDFDSYLSVGTGSCDAFTVTAQDDDGGGGLNARVTHQGDGGLLLIRANTVGTGEIGSYQLRVTGDQSRGQRPSAPAGAASVTRLDVGQTVNGTLSASDAILPDNSFYDCFAVQTRQGQALQIDMTSNDVDSFLSIGNGSCETLVAQEGNDDGGDGLNSRIVRAGDGRVLFIRANSVEAGETGAYQLRVSPAPSQAGPASKIQANPAAGSGNAETGVTPATAPFYLMKQDSETIMLASAGSVRRSGNLATATVVTGTSRETMAQSDGAAWITAHWEVDCSGNRVRAMRHAAFDAQGGLLLAIDGDQTWSAVEPTAPSALLSRVACNGERPASLEIQGTPLSISAAYREGRLPPRR